MTDAAVESAPQTMYLQELEISGFRSCYDLKVELCPTLTLLVGENNAGKSNVVDALRLLTLPLSGRRGRYFEIEDRSRHHVGSINLTGTFSGLSKFQRAQYIGALNTETGHATFTTRYHLPDDHNRRGRVEQLAGGAFMPDSEPEKRDQINHVYLAPLRDAQRELDSASGTRLGLIMEHLVDQKKKDDFVKKAKESLGKLSNHDVVQATNRSIQGHMSGLTEAVREQRVGMAFEEPELLRLAKSLRLKMAEHGIDLTDLSSSGLGYANLLYLSTVVLELQKAKDSELTLFLVEEPEAHLHPQLQGVLLDYLREQAEQSVQDDADGPAGRIQIVATTHSPNLASAVSTSNVVALRSVKRDFGNEEDGPPVASYETKALALSRIELTPEDRRKVDQYLDVTRSELLFTQRAVLVEGVAEAVLVPALARHCVLSGEEEDAIKRRRSFRGASIISVGSVDFAPYIRLLLGHVDGIRLVDNLVVITDGDPVVPGDDPDQVGDGSEVVYNRAEALRALGAELGSAEELYVAEAPHTLEADLLVERSTNHEVLGEAYLKQHIRSSEKWQGFVSSADPADALYRALRKDKRLLAKGQFAHDIAARINEGVPFVCPGYLKEAIERIVDGPAT